MTKLVSGTKAPHWNIPYKTRASLFNSAASGLCCPFESGLRPIRVKNTWLQIIDRYKCGWELDSRYASWKFNGNK